MLSLHGRTYKLFIARLCIKFNWQRALKLPSLMNWIMHLRYSPLNLIILLLYNSLRRNGGYKYKKSPFEKTVSKGRFCFSC